MKYLKSKYQGIRLGFKALIIAAALMTGSFLVFDDYTSAAANVGEGRVVNVVATGSACLAGPNGNSVESWEVQQGGTYEVTLANVTDAGNGGTDPTIEVIVKSSNTGNQCLTAFNQGPGVYTFTITMPNNACQTFPITYGSTGCAENTAKFARRSNGEEFQSHLRAATFDGSCNLTGLVTY